MSRNWKQEYRTQKQRGEDEDQLERQRARREFDKKNTGSTTKKSPKRKGKDLSHNKALSKGGSNKDGVKLENRSKNRSRNYQNQKKKSK